MNAASKTGHTGARIPKYPSLLTKNKEDIQTGMHIVSAMGKVCGLKKIPLRAFTEKDIIKTRFIYFYRNAWEGSIVC